MTPASHIFFSERLRLHYIDWGNSDAPTMVLVHGIQDHGRTWDDLVAYFASDYHVVVPDLRGHGDSEWVRGSSYHYLDYVYDLHQLISQADLGPVTLVGHSMGGSIAAFYAGIYPEMIERLVVIEGIGLWSDLQPPRPAADKIREWIDNTRALSARLPRRYPALSDAYQRMQQANPQLSDKQALHLTVHGSNRNEDGTFSWKYDNYTHNFSSAGLSGDEARELWQNITAPVLVIIADDGLEHRIGHDGTLAYFADASLVEVADAGHWTYHDDLPGVAGHMRRFLAGATTAD
ncbi:MAG: alpha/beta hydrolase [Pseudomonadota bacterium]